MVKLGPRKCPHARGRVDIRRMWSFLHCHLLTPRSVLGCFIEGIASGASLKHLGTLPSGGGVLKRVTHRSPF